MGDREVIWAWKSAGEQNHPWRQEDLEKVGWEGELNLQHDAKSPAWVQGLGELVCHRNAVLLKSRDRAVRTLIGLHCPEQPHVGPLPTPSACGPGAVLKLRPGLSSPSCALL